MSADEFVDGATIDWPGVARRGFGYIFGGLIVTLVGYVQLLGDGFVEMISAPGDVYSWLIESILTLPLSSTSDVVSETVPFIQRTGPFAFIVSIVIVGGSGYIMIRGLQKAYSVLLGGIA